jgi:hypothetical protein
VAYGNIGLSSCVPCSDKALCHDLLPELQSDLLQYRHKLGFVLMKHGGRRVLEKMMPFCHGIVIHRG